METGKQNPLDGLRGKTILVMGGCGFIGSNFIRYLFDHVDDVRVINLDALTYSGNRENLADIEATVNEARYKCFAGDISEPAAVETMFIKFKPDYVINFAAETHVDRSIHVGSYEFIKTNIVGVYNILEAVKKYGCVKYVQVSTDEVYGQLPNPHDVPSDEVSASQIKEEYKSRKFTENSPYKPNVPYSATKAGGDCLCNAYHHTWNVPVVVTHCSNNYGPYQYPEKLVPFWATRLLAGEKVPMYGDGLNIRDWIHVEDHIRGLLFALVNGVPGTEYLFGADNERTNLEMAELIMQGLGVEYHSYGDFLTHIEFVQDRPGHDRRYAIDYSLAREQLGWEPMWGHDKFKEKLGETLMWYKNNVEWSKAVIAKTGVANPHIDLWKAHNIT
jgi:dTDP-glucose 4,6-dehydratase